MPPAKTKKPAVEPFRPKVWWACVHCGMLHGELESPPEQCDYCGRRDDFDNVWDLWDERGWLAADVD
jgi:rubrerythrin